MLCVATNKSFILQPCLFFLTNAFEILRPGQPQIARTQLQKLDPHAPPYGGEFELN